MTPKSYAPAHAGVTGRICALGATALIGCVTGCSSGPARDARVSPETYDEYLEPLTNAVVGSPSGVVIIGPDGGVTAVDAGSGASGSAGSSSASASSSTGPSGAGGGGPVGVTPGPIPLPPPPPADGGIVDASPGDGGDGGQSGGFGSWHFDDCSPTSHFLVDSSGAGADAQHALNAECVPGINGLGVEFRSAKDVVEVPDEPQFTVDSRIAVAAWVFPTTVAGDQPIVVKRLNSKTSFSLGIHKGNIEMSVVLADGTTVISSAPLPANQWSHVAGMFDGTFLFLFLDGQQFGQVFAAGKLRDVFAPIRIGATTQSQYFHGIVDEVFVSTQAITKDTLTALACISKRSSLGVNPETGGPAPFNTPVHYQVSVADNDTGFCQPKNYNFFFQGFDPAINTVVDFPPGSFQTAQAGETVTFGVDVTATEDADPGLHSIPFGVQSFDGSFGGNFEFIPGALNFVVAAPTGCFVSTKRELLITNPSVVGDPVRAPDPGATGVGRDGGFASDSGIVIIGGSGSSSGVSTASGGSIGIGKPLPPPSLVAFAATGTAASGVPASGGTTASSGGFSSGGGSTSSSGFVNGGGSAGSSGLVGGEPGDAGSDAPADAQRAPASSAGVWTFGHLMRNIASTPESAPAMTEQLFDTWLSDQVVNGFTVAARPAMKPVLLDIWPRTSDGALDLDRAPLRLQAIVNRIDLRRLSAGSAGEGRFVFGVDDASGGPQQFTVIVEYNLPATTEQDVLDWANRWHALSTHPFPSEEYNAALEAITERFAGRNASPGSVNGSALLSLRTNEIVLSSVGRWELREFMLSPATGFLHEVPVEETPDLGFNGSATFADFVNQNAAAIIAEVPGGTGTVPAQFDGGSFLGGSIFNDLVEWSAPGIKDPEARFHASLNTCNGCHGPETNTAFLMITPRVPGGEATLSSFMTGTTVFDPATGQSRTLNDLSRRRADLTSLVCGPSDGGPPPPPPVDAPPPPPVDAGVPLPFDTGVPAPVGDASTGRVPPPPPIP